MVNPFAAFRHEFFHRGLGMERFEELDAAVANRQHRYANALLLDVFVSGNLEANHALVEFQRAGNGTDRDPDMIDPARAAKNRLNERVGVGLMACNLVEDFFESFPWES